MYSVMDNERFVGRNEKEPSLFGQSFVVTAR